MYDLLKEKLKDKDNEKAEMKEKLQPQLQIDQVVQKIQMRDLESIYPEGSNIFVDKVNVGESEESRNLADVDDDEEGLFDANEENKMKPVQMKSIEFENDYAIASDRIIDNADGLSESTLFEYVPPTQIKGKQYFKKTKIKFYCSYY